MAAGTIPTGNRRLRSVSDRHHLALAPMSPMPWDDPACRRSSHLIANRRAFRRARLSQFAYQVPAGDTAAGDKRLYRTLSLVNLAIWTMVTLQSSKGRWRHLFRCWKSMCDRTVREFGDWQRNPMRKSRELCPKRNRLVRGEAALYCTAGGGMRLHAGKRGWYVRGGRVT